MERAVKIDLVEGYVTFCDESKKTLDNYILELEDRLNRIYEKLKEYEDVEPWSTYKVSGAKLFDVMDILEDRK